MNAAHERTILDIRPSWVYLLLRRSGLLIGCLVLGVLGLLMMLSPVLPGIGLWLAVGALVAMFAVLICNRIERDGERYLLTDTRAVQKSRLIRRLETEAPISRLQHAMMYQSLPERLFGIGTIGLATAGSDSVEIVWWMVERPSEVLAQVRAAMTAGQSRVCVEDDGVTSTMSTPHPKPPSSAQGSLPVIGLAGGIGSGKTTVARELEALGCLVIDSDQKARAALDRPDVRTKLVEWWGDRILTRDGKVDRSKVAAIVFAKREERERLEGLVHPIVRQDRAAMIAEAEGPSERQYSAVVIDAPLLFEAALDKECDAVIFVDVPRQARLERVRASRGWTEQELTRREAAQIDLAEKRRRSTFVVDNSGVQEGLRSRLASILAEIQAGREP